MMGGLIEIKDHYVIDIRMITVFKKTFKFKRHIHLLMLI
jgi:hypothetical protein